MKRWLFSALAATVIVLAMLWLAGSVLHLVSDPAEVSITKPNPEERLRYPEYSDVIGELKERMEDIVIEPKVRSHLDSDSKAVLQEIKEGAAMPIPALQSKKVRQFVRVVPKTQEHCEGWVQISFMGAQDIISGTYKILKSKPPGKYDRDALQALADSFLVESASPLTWGMRQNGQAERVFTYSVDCASGSNWKEETED